MLSELEQEAVEEAWNEAAGGSTSQGLQASGCLVAFAGMAALTLTPALGAFVEVGSGMANTLLALAILFLFSGAGLALTGSLSGARSRRNDIEESVARVVAAHEAGRPEASAEAARLLARLRAVHPAHAPDPGETARRLGPALPEVRRVQAHLIHRGLLPPP